MIEPTITVIETEATGYREVRKELPLSEIEELFRDNDSSLVWPLCKLVRQQEEVIAGLRSLLKVTQAENLNLAMSLRCRGD